MAFANHRRARTRESGNIFTFLFGAVAVVGVITVVTMQLVAGPIKTASRVNAINMANAQMQASGRILIIDAANQANSGDVDSDGTIEPRAFTTQSGGITGGGIIPTSVGAARTDPWGIPYAYCVWNNGSSYGALTNILAGAQTTSAPVPTVIAIVSSGPDKVFQTSCVAYSGGNTTGDTTTTGVIKTSGSDDIVMKWSYAEALAASAGLWNIKAGAPDTATIGKNLEVTDPNNANAVTASINRQTGIGDFLGVTTNLLTPKTGTNMTLNGTLVAGPLSATAGNVTVTNQYGAGMLNVLGTQYSSGNTILAYGLKPDPTSASYLSSVYLAGNPFARSALEVGYGGFTFRTAPSSDTAIGTVIGTDPQMVINASGRVGIGITTPGSAISGGLNPLFASNVRTDILNLYSSASAPTEPQVALRATSAIGGTGVGSAATNPAGVMIGGAFTAENSSSDHTNSQLRASQSLASNYGTATIAYGAINQAANQIGGTATNIVGSSMAGINFSNNGASVIYGSLSQGASQATSGTTTTIYGGYNNGYNYTAGATSATVTNLYGGYNYARNYANSTTGTMYGAYNYALNEATATTMYGAFNDAYLQPTATTAAMTGSYTRALGYGTTSGDIVGEMHYALNGKTASSVYGTYTQAENNSSATATSSIRGAYTLARNWQPTGTLATLYGTHTIAQNYGTATINNLYGNYIEAAQYAAGTILSLVGQQVVVGGNAGTLTNAYGVDIDLSGTLPTYYYGLKIEDEGSSNANYYSIYTGTTKSYFGGNVGIGTTVPNAPLDIKGGSAANDTTAIIRFSYDGVGSGDYHTITSSYNGASGGSIGFNVERATGDVPRVMTLLGGTVRVGIGTSTPVSTLQVNGTVTATNVTLTSDARKKDNVKTLSDSLADVLRLNPVSFTWKEGTDESKDDKGVRYGFLAQEVEKIFPNIVKTDSKGMKSVDYMDLFAPVVDAIQSLNEKIEKLFDTIGKLTVRVDALEKENALLKARLDKLEAAKP